MEKKNILIIEDDRSIARLIEIVLTGKGFNIHVCLDADGALDIFRRVQPDLVILDIHMPRHGGMSVLKKLREEGSAEVPVIVFSVLARRQSIEQLMKLGASEFVPKSAGIDALVERVVSALGL